MGRLNHVSKSMNHNMTFSARPKPNAEARRNGHQGTHKTLFNSNQDLCCSVSHIRPSRPPAPAPSLAMDSFAWTLLASLVVLAGHADVAVAPFPPEHAYHWLNPWIEPWWVHLSKGEQEKIYGHWEKVEPLLISVADRMAAKTEFIQSKLGDIALRRKQH